MILTVNSDYFFKQHQPVDLNNGEVLCFLCGTDCILKYYLDKIRLQRINFTRTLLHGVISWLWMDRALWCSRGSWTSLGTVLHADADADSRLGSSEYKEGGGRANSSWAETLDIATQRLIREPCCTSAVINGTVHTGCQWKLWQQYACMPHNY
jgi:hypothetical protein